MPAWKEHYKNGISLLFLCVWGRGGIKDVPSENVFGVWRESISRNIRETRAIPWAASESGYYSAEKIDLLTPSGKDVPVLKKSIHIVQNNSKEEIVKMFEIPLFHSIKRRPETF